MTEGGVKHRTVQLVSPRLDEHERIAIDCINAFKDQVDSIYIVRGTPAHVEVGAQMEERIAIAVNAERWDERHSSYQLWLEASKVRFHFTHHRSGDGRPWSAGNAMRVVILEMKDFCFENDHPYPHLCVRAHMHKFWDTHDEHSKKIRGLALGAWSLVPEYVHKSGKPQLAEIGGYIIECDNGEYEVHKRHYKPPKRHREAYLKWTKNS